MATVITGRDITLTIALTQYAPQTLSTTLTVEDDQQIFETFAGPVYKTITQGYTLDVEMLADWGATDSLCEALQVAFNTAPDTAIGFALVATGPDSTVTFSGEVFPKTPELSGTGVEASQVSVTLQGNVNETLTVL